MLSRKNYKEKLEKMEPRKERFSIRKFSVGAASVLIGFFLIGMNQTQSVKADTLNTNGNVNTGEETPHETTTSKTLTNGQEGKNVVVKEVDKKELNTAQTQSSETTKEQTQGQILAVKKDTDNTANTLNDASAQSNESKVEATKETVANNETKKITTKSTNEKTVVNENEEPAVANISKEYNDLKAKLKAGSISNSDAKLATQKLEEQIGKLSAADKAKLTLTSLAATTTSQSQEVNNAKAFLNAINDSNIGTINLGGDINFTGYTDTTNIDGSNARAVTINVGTHSLNLADKTLDFEHNKADWDLTFVGDNTQNAKGQNSIEYNTNTPIEFGEKTNVTFKNVNINGNGQFGQTGGNSANLKLSGYNNINIAHKDGNAALLVESVEVTDGVTTINHSDDEKNVQYNSGIFIDSTNNGGNVTIDDGAVLTVNGETSNAMGIFFDGSDSQGTIDSVRTGLIKVGKNATLNINLKDGNSAAIYADDIDVLDGGTVDITTAQNTTGNGTGTMNGAAPASTSGLGGIHNGVVNLGMHGTNLNPTLRIAKDATFKVNRTSDKSSSALLSFNTIGLSGGMTSSVLVNGGSLDLQDHANNYGYFFQSGQGPYGNLPHVGLITMWGTSSKSRIDFEAPKYVNFERFGKAVGRDGDKTDGKTGAFLRLESNDVAVDINKSSANVVTPLQQWGNENTTEPYKWYVVKEHNTNQWGDNASGFVKQGTKVNVIIVHQGVATFGESNGSATVAESAAADANKTVYNNAALTNAPQYMDSFLNNFNWWSPQHMTFGSDLIISSQYTPSYKPVTVEQGQSATDDPAFTDQDGKDTTAPTGTTFTTGTDTPDWATVDPSNGTVTVKPNTDVTPGAYNVPVTVTYPDKSTDETTVPIIVTKAGQTVTWGDNGAIVTTVDTSKLNAHETTDNSQVLSADGVVTAEGYELTDGKLSTTATPITIDPSTVSWTTTPDTNVDTATAAGKEITTGISIDFTNNDAAKNILGSKNGTVTTNPFTIDAKGAGAKNVTTPVNVAFGSDLTSEQFGQLVENNIPTDEIASTTWATKPDANGQGGVIKITFTDKDANGQPTYLNVNIPASSIKVTTDADENTPEGQDVSTKVGEVPDAESGIKNPGSLPSGTTYTWKDTPDTTTPGKKPAVVVVTYPDGSKDEVPTNVIVNAKPEIKPITTTVGGDPAANEGIANLKDKVEGYPTSATWTTKPDTSKPGATTGTATVTYPDGTKETVTIPVTVNKSSQVTMTYDFYSTVTIDNPDGTSTTEPRQHISFTYLGIPTDADVNVEFKNVAIPSFDGYTPEVSLTTPSAEGTPMATLEKGVDGKWTLKLPKPELSYPYYNYTISYKKSGSETPTDADKYTPEGQDVNTKTGVVPDPADGIKNKGDLPDGTKYTWKETPDVTTAGDKPATVVVTYPDGSKDEVPVTIHVTNPTTPTDADKYTPEGQDVNTKTDVVPDPADGIKNKGDLPDGTKYTWKTTPDVSTEGNKPAVVVVTYPDGSKDEVPVTIHVTNPTTPTDADKYTPEGQDVNTKTGVVPDPAEGIKNKGDLPDGTKYTWKTTPDVTTPGDKPATVVVTYPDGSKDEVPVTIHVTNPTTPTDADKYTPEGQDVNTKTGVVPDPADGIKNKGDLPAGTKYTWKTTPDVTTPGDKPTVVVVTYPDGSKDEVPVTVHVTNPTTPTDADKYTPEGQDVNTKTGVVPDPADGIKNKGDLPAGTKYTWKTTPDISTEGNKPAVVVVTYPDGSKDEVPVTIHVTNPTTPVTPTTPTDADEYTPEGQDVHTVVGKVPDPAEGIKNKGDLPADTKYTWENTPDVSTTGTHPAVVVVTYPDGSQDRVPVNVVVTNPTPEGQDVHTTPGNVPNPGDGIKNKDEMPDGTKYTWKDTPDTTTPGTHPAVIVVHFPDGTTQEVTVNIIVDNNNADNNANTGNNSNHGDKSTNTGLVNNGNTNGMNNTNSNSGSQIANTNTGKKTLPQTGSQSTTALGAIGLAIASIGSLFGLGAGKKRKDQ